MKRWLGFCVIAALALGSVAAAEPAQPFDGVELDENEVLERDLDGDASAENVHWYFDQWDEYGDGEIVVEASETSGEKVEWRSGMLYPRGVYVADLDGDGRTELLVCGDEASDDYVTFCLRYENGSLSQLPFADARRGDVNEGYIDAGYGLVTGIEGNRLTLKGSQDVLGTYFGKREFTLQNDVFEFADDGLWHFDEISPDDEAWQYRSLNPLKNIPVVWLDGDTESEGEIEAGVRFTITASDKISLAYIVTEDGRTGRLNVAPNAEMGWGWTVDGMTEEELFEFVPYAD